MGFWRESDAVSEGLGALARPRSAAPRGSLDWHEISCHSEKIANTLYIAAKYKSRAFTLFQKELSKKFEDLSFWLIKIIQEST